MENTALKLEEPQKEILTVKNIHQASEFDNSEVILDKAFDVYNEVVAALPTLPVKLLPRLRNSFNQENTLVAFDENNEVVGVALTEKLENPEETIGRFGKKAVKYCAEVYGYNDEAIYELEAIAVKPTMRKRGLGHAFYEAAKKTTNNRCIAVVTEKNVNGQKTAISGGFNKIPGSLFKAPFTIENGVAKLDIENGTHIVRANLFASKKKELIIPIVSPYTFMPHSMGFGY